MKVVIHLEAAMPGMRKIGSTPAVRKKPVVAMVMAEMITEVITMTEITALTVMRQTGLMKIPMGPMNAKVAGSAIRNGVRMNPVITVIEAGIVKISMKIAAARSKLKVQHVMKIGGVIRKLAVI